MAALLVVAFAGSCGGQPEPKRANPEPSATRPTADVKVWAEAVCGAWAKWLVVGHEAG